jgi:hypothetical protein
MIRRCGRGGKIHSFWAMYSLRMSVWRVPSRTFQDTPCFSAAARKKAKRIAAGPEIVIEVVMSPRGMPSNSVSKSTRESVATPQRRVRVVGIAPHQRGHVEGDREAPAPLPQEVLVAPVRLLGRPEAGELPHRPQASAVHRGVDPTRVRVLAGVAEVPIVVEVRDVLGRVEGLDGFARDRLEVGVALGRLPVPLPPLVLPLRHRASSFNLSIRISAAR